MESRPPGSYSAAPSTGQKGEERMDWRSTTLAQLNASIAMLENAIVACPDGLWGDRTRQPEFWYTAFHPIFWLDLYLSPGPDAFTPPAPFTLDELDPAGILPDRVYKKEELLSYLRHGKAKCVAVVTGMTDETASQRCGFDWLELNNAELLLYTMRHVQHHAAQLNMHLRQAGVEPPRWVRRSPLP